MAAVSGRSIQSEEYARGSGIGELSFMVLLGLLLSYFLFLAVRDRNGFLSLFLGVAVLILIAVTILLIREKRMRRRFGDVRLELSGEDAHVGGRFTATLAAPPGLGVFELEAVLACYRVTHGSKNQKHREPVWARRPRVPVRAGRIDIAIDIPADLNASMPMPETSWKKRDGAGWEWDLTVAAPQADEKFCYTFPVTVGGAMSIGNSAAPASGGIIAERVSTAAQATPSAWPAQYRHAAAPASEAIAVIPDIPTGERRTLGAGQLAALVAVNLIPLAGAAFLGWRFQEAIALYWAETVIMSLFAALYLLLSHDYTAMVDKANQERDRLDLEPIQEANTLGQRISGFLGTALIYGALCAITGYFILAIPGPNNATFWQGLMQHSGSLWLGVLLIAAYQLWIFLFDYREHMITRPMYRLGAIYSAMLPLIVAMLISPNGGVIVMLAFVMVKIWYEKKLREAELNQSPSGNAPTVAEAVMHASAPRQQQRGENKSRRNGPLT